MVKISLLLPNRVGEPQVDFKQITAAPKICVVTRVAQDQIFTLSSHRRGQSRDSTTPILASHR